MEILEDIQSRFAVEIKPLPDTIDVSTYSKLFININLKSIVNA